MVQQMKQICFLHLGIIITLKLKQNTLPKEMTGKKYKDETSVPIPMSRYFPGMNFPKQGFILKAPKWMDIFSPHEQHTRHNGQQKYRQQHTN
jgi:hypothetical protein